MAPDEYLQAKGFKVRGAPGEWQTQCPFCGDQNKYGHLYVNREHGAYMCHRCQATGSFFDLQVKLGDKPEPVAKSVADKRAVWADVVAICQDELVDNNEARQYLRQTRDLSAEAIAKYRLGWVPGNLIDRLLELGWKIPDIQHAGLMSERNYPLFWDRVLIPYFQRDQVVLLRAKEPGGNVLQTKDTSIGLFGVDNLRGHKEVYVCEGEFDAMYLDQLGFAAVGVPGAGNFQEHWVTWFDEATKVFVVLDADEAGQRGAARIEQMLGKRAKVVDLPVPDECKSTDITEFFTRDGNRKQDFVRLIEQFRGRRVFTVGQSLWERDALLQEEGIKLGIADLDYAIHPGLLPGQVVCVLAKTGTGKTAFLSQLCHNMSAWQTPGGKSAGPGIPTLVLSLEQTRPEYTNRLDRIAKLYNPFANVDELNKWYCNLRICDENRVPASDLPALVEEFIEDVGTPPKVLVLDYLGYWARGFKGKSRYEQVSEAIMELKRIAKTHGLVILTAHQVSRSGKNGQRLELDDARDSGVIEETADFAFGLYRPHQADVDDAEQPHSDRSEIIVEVLKSRHGNVGRRSVLSWAPYSLAMVGMGDYSERIGAEWEMYDLQSMYEDVVGFHQARAGDARSLF